MFEREGACWWTLPSLTLFSMGLPGVVCSSSVGIVH